MYFKNFIPTIALLALGGFGGFIASLTLMPLPWMLGALIATAGFTIARPDSLPNTYKFPMLLRMLFIAVIGVMIGAQGTPDLVARAPLTARGSRVTRTRRARDFDSMLASERDKAGRACVLIVPASMTN